MHIRRANLADARSLAELNQAFNGVCRSSDQIRNVLNTDGSTEAVLVAEDSREVVGVAP